ncbi:MAG: NlpC/P60 family protein [Hyphomonas sp.]
MPDYSDRRLTPPAGMPTPYQVSKSVAAIYETPDHDSRLATQALQGETLMVFNSSDDFVSVQLDRDRYVGWARKSDLTARNDTQTAPNSPETASNCTLSHKVCTARTHAYSAPDLKTRPLACLSLGSRVSVLSVEGDWANCGAVGWVHMRHLSPIATYESDPASVAERFVGTPYLWGGRESLGIDCTGLSQQAFEACGVLLPRDSDMQAAWCGTEIADWQSPGALRRGDLVFWKGHVGIMLDADTLLHANAWHMAVAREPLTGAIERIRTYYAEPTGARRIDVQTSVLETPDWLK